MILSLAENIETIKNEIAAFTGVNVKHGMPDDSEPGLYLFPYNFSVDPQFRNITTRDIKSQTTTSYHVRFLLIPGRSIDYVALNKGLNYISVNPVLETKRGAVRFILENVPTEELTSVFISAGVTYRLSVPFKMHYTANS